MSDASNLEAVLTAYDTPTQRASIANMAVADLEAMLHDIRERRLVAVRKLEELAQVKADEARLELFMKYERALITARRAVAKADEAETKLETAIHKVRLLVMAIHMEVG
jgi:hypothetical protein